VGPFGGDPAAFFAALVLKIPALLLAVTVHEVAHAIAADRLGDPTPRRLGRITLNPLPHLDLLGALAFVVAGFGWAKPVPVDARYFRHPLRDMAWVAAAGPLSNFLTAFVGLVVFVVVRRAALGASLMEPVGGILFWIFEFNLALGIFNLIPLPPLDGGHFLPYLLPRGASDVLRTLHQYGPMILLILVFTGATRYVVGPVFDVVMSAYIALVRLLF
jgi:Zn-dependent protease